MTWPQSQLHDGESRIAKTGHHSLRLRLCSIRCEAVGLPWPESVRLSEVGPEVTERLGRSALSAVIEIRRAKRMD